MQPGAWKHFAIAAVLALALYVTGYTFIEHLRQRKGGWQVTFVSDAAGHPKTIVSQPVLGITNVQFRFMGEKITAVNVQEMVVFDRPIVKVPFGSIIFIDTTFLPGTVTFDWFGHEVQLLPRVLMVNKREIPWQTGQVIELSPEEK